jgi:oligopeptide/dipeptide ABC transporter ATP-binding protein
MRCVPQVNASEVASRKALLPVIGGAPPSMAVLSQGCVFEPRCDERMELCQIREPAAAMLGNLHEVSCLKYPA